MSRRSVFLAALAAATAFSLAAADFADARSIGSRGSRTFSAPPVTRTAPQPAQPIQRSTTPQPAPGQTRPTAGAPAQAPRPGLFGGGLAGNLMRGLLIGGLIGMLLGHGIGGLAGLLGLLLQGALIALAVMLVLRFLRGRQQPAGAGAPYGQQPYTRDAAGPAGRPGPNGGVAGMAGSGPMGVPPYQPAAGGPSDEIGIGQSDYDAFERLLGEILTAFSKQDQAVLRERTTPEVFSFFADELRTDAEQNVRKEITEVKLLQGDLAEAWREGSVDYATVAVRYGSKDAVYDRQTGAVVAGDPNRPVETTEVWTFTRPAGGAWVLAAIQEAPAQPGQAA